MIPIVQNFDTNRIPVEGSSTFRANASYVWSAIPLVINSMNNTILQINVTSDDIQNNANAAINAKNSALSYKSEANTYKNAAEAAKNEAVNAKNAIEGYVVPTDATYTSTDIDNKLTTQIDATHPFNGYIGSKKDMRFETSTNNILKVANMQEQYIVDGKVVGTLGEELVVNGDFSSVLGSEWTTTSAATVSIVGGRLRVVTTNLDKGVFQSGVVTRGTTYKVSGYAQGEHISVRSFDGISQTNIQTTEGYFNFYVTMSADSTTLPFRLYLDSSGTAYFDNISVREVSTIDLNTTNDRTGFNGEGDNSFVPHVHVVGFDPISTGTITGNRVATDAQIGTILDNIPAQTANTRIKCRVKPTTDGIKVEILDKSDSDAVVRTQTVDGTDVETLTFTLPVNNDGYKVKATKITNDGVDSDDTDERIDVTAEVSTGLVVDGKVKRGDYVVVDKEELVTNGTFDVDTNGWTATNDATLTIENNILKVSGDSYPHATQSINLVAGVSYIIQYSASGDLSSNVRWVLKDSDGANVYISPDDLYEENKLIVVQKTDNYTFYFGCGIDDESIAYFDNISVQLADDIFKAIEDTDDGESLGSSKFKPADYISNQVFVGMKDDGTYTYDVLMNDAYAKESTTETLTNNGYASLGRGLFSKGSNVITPIGYWQTLNKGAYHPILNFAGTTIPWRKNGQVSGVYWNKETAKELDIVSKCFDASVNTNTEGEVSPFVRGDRGMVSSGVTGGPDSVDYLGGKFYDIIYPSQWLDMCYSSTETNLHDTASKVFSDGISGKGGVCDTVGMTRLPTEPYKQQHEYIEDGTLVYLPITQVGEQLTAKAYCDPSLYPQILKDKLVNGQVIVGIAPTLIDQNGNNIIPAGQTEFSLCNTKAKEVHNVIVSTNPEEDKPTYSSETVVADYVENKITQTLNTGDFALVSSTASIPVATIQDPKIVDYVLEKYVATNSNEIALGNNITSLIGVGTGTGASETNTIGNVIVDADGLIVTEPSHKIISLDNSGDKASKAFLTIASDENNELYAQWMVEEVKGDGDTGDFSQLTNGTKEDFNGNVCRTVVASRPLGLFKENK